MTRSRITLALPKLVSLGLFATVQYTLGRSVIRSRAIGRFSSPGLYQAALTCPYKRTRSILSHERFLGSRGWAEKARWQHGFSTVAPTPSSDKDSPERGYLGPVEPSYAQSTGNMHLPAVLLENLMAWVAKYHELRVEHPTGLILNAQPHHVRGAHKQHGWGVVYNPERHLLLSWGDVPEAALIGLRDLDTSELLIPETATSRQEVAGWGACTGFPA